MEQQVIRENEDNNIVQNENKKLKVNKNIMLALIFGMIVGVVLGCSIMVTFFDEKNRTNSTKNSEKQVEQIANTSVENVEKQQEQSVSAVSEQNVNVSTDIESEQQEQTVTTPANTESDRQEQSVNTIDEMLEQEGFTVTTPLVDLYYPEKWKEKIRVGQIEGDIHVVQFWATIKEKEEIHIFDIVFGSEEEYVLGYFEGENKEKIPVNIISYDFELSEDWTEEERNELYVMMEDINYIINRLQEEDGFMRAY